MHTGLIAPFGEPGGPDPRQAGSRSATVRRARKLDLETRMALAQRFPDRLRAEVLENLETQDKLLKRLKNCLETGDLLDAQRLVTSLEKLNTRVYGKPIEPPKQVNHDVTISLENPETRQAIIAARMARDPEALARLASPGYLAAVRELETGSPGLEGSETIDVDATEIPAEDTGDGPSL